MIRITNGIFGLHDKNGNIVPKTAKSAPFELDKELETRLVREGVAEFVTAAPEVAKEPEHAEGKTSNVNTGLYDDNTKFNELKEIAVKLGATEEELKDKKSKNAIKALIDELANKPEEDGKTPDEGESTEDEGEEAPTFDGDGVAE